MQTPKYIITRLLLCSCLMAPMHLHCEESQWSLGGYGGKYYDTEPAGVLYGNARFIDQYIVAITANRTVWRSELLPLSLEIDGMIGHQYGIANLQEIGVAPVVKWSGFPWTETLPTYVRLAPLGVSYTSSISPLERGPTGDGSRTLNLLLIELGFSLPSLRSENIFVRLHHRCNIYDLLNDHGANGEDFLSLGYRYNF